MSKLIVLPILLILAFNLAYAQDQNVRQEHHIIYRNMIVSNLCSNKGYLYAGRCYCIEGFKGRNCSQLSFQGYDNNNITKCDDLTARLDHLSNISPEFGTFDDNEFSRFSNNTIGPGEASYGAKGSSWIPMHSVSQNFSIFNKNYSIQPQDVGQGGLGNCYFLAALASLANIRNGSLITDIFETLEDNANRTYVAKFLLDGKVRYVGVDDWVPGSGSSPSFARPVNNNQFWVMILEKMWAKIHGNYMATQLGTPANVWKAMTQAPVSLIFHSNSNSTYMFQLLTSFFNNQWAVGAGTVNNNKKKDLVQGHAYAVLGTYNFTNENGTRILLVKCYNPWHSENNYPQNPWADNSTNWTAAAKAATTYNQDNMPGNSFNDGIFYLTHQDYFDQFGVTSWAEIYEGYGMNFQEVPLQASVAEKVYSVRFNYTGNQSKPFYVSVEDIDGRLFRGCPDPFYVEDMIVILPNNKTAQAYYEKGELITTAKISGDQIQNGTYRVDVYISGAYNYHKYFTVSTYSEKDKVQFLPRNQNDTYNETFTKLCPKNCSRHGICNTFTGVCQCDYAWNTTADCSVKTAPKCLNNCNGKGICMDGNTCKCNKMYMGDDCQPCSDLKGTANCKYWQSFGYFDFVKFPQYKSFIEQSCALSAQIGNCKP